MIAGNSLMQQSYIFSFYYYFFFFIQFYGLVFISSEFKQLVLSSAIVAATFYYKKKNICSNDIQCSDDSFIAKNHCSYQVAKVKGDFAIQDSALCLNDVEGTSRQRSGKGAIRKRFPLQKPRWEKNKLTIRYFIP